MQCEAGCIDAFHRPNHPSVRYALNDTFNIGHSRTHTLCADCAPTQQPLIYISALNESAGIENALEARSLLSRAQEAAVRVSK